MKSNTKWNTKSLSEIFVNYRRARARARTGRSLAVAICSILLGLKNRIPAWPSIAAANDRHFTRSLA
jgi:hypothetical protein